jgi:hypothetical protein
MDAAATKPIRLLVVTNETAEGEALFDTIDELAAERGAAVLVVAPALNSRLRHWMSDEDAARRDAEARLGRCLARLDEAGLYVRGWVGDANPLCAIEDALRRFSADEIVVATHPEARSNWLAHGLVAKARLRFGLPVTHVVVDLAEHTSYVAA